MSADLPELIGNQRRAADLRGRDIAVTAGAGTGKTRTLVGRYLSLLEEGCSPRQILAITFTEKAAREMRNRARSAVRARGDHAVTPEQRAFWVDLEAGMEAARIGTIHSFCAEVLRSHPAQAGVDPEFKVVEEGISAMLRQQAVEEALAWAALDPEVAPLFTSFSPRGLGQVLSFLLERRLDAASALKAEADEGGRWRRAVKLALDAVVDAPEVTDRIAALRRLEEDGDLPQDAGDKLADQIAALLADWEEMLAERRSGDLLGVATRLFAIRRNRMRLNVGKKNSQAKALLTGLRQTYDDRLGPWLGGGKADDPAPDQAAESSFAQDLPRLTALFRQAEDAYRTSLDEQFALDFDDLEQKALDLLGIPEIRERWQAELSTILVDEFQDTNGRQRDIIQALWGDTPGRVFVVGDARQSIYRFRGADVTVFRRMGESIKARGGEPIGLDTTFRPHQGLLSVLDRLISPIMGSGEDPDRLYVVAYTPMTAHRAQPREGMKSPFVEFVIGAGEDAEAARPRAALALVERLQELHAERQIASWEDVALLFRASTGFAAYENALEGFGIPFVTVAGRGFYDRPEVRDLLNILQALAQPWDDLALAGLLRSPAFGLSDAGLYRLRSNGGAPRPIRSELQADLGKLDVPDQAAALRAREFLEGLEPLVDRLPVAELLKRVIDRADYRAALASAHHRYWRNVDKLLADAHASRLVQVRAFLDYVRTLRDVGAREGEAPVEADGAVRLMTIHKAKGLEFPFVVLADASRQSRNTAQTAYLPPDTGLVFKGDRSEAQSLAYGLAGWLDGQQSEAEDSRLLYVAATRAQDKLLISGHVTGSTGDWRADGWLRQLLEVAGYDLDTMANSAGQWHSVELGSGAEVTALLAAQEIERLETKDESPLPAAPEPALAPLYRSLIQRGVEELPPEPEEEPRRDWRTTGERVHPPAAVVGSMVHKAIECWLFPGDEGFEGLLHTVALAEGLVEPHQQQEAVAHASRLLGRLRTHPLWDEIAHADEHYHEVPYTRPVAGGRPELGVLDLLYRTGRQWVLLDFKIDELRDDAAAEAATIKYRGQMERYTQAARFLLGAEVLPRLCYLDYCNGVRLVVL